MKPEKIVESGYDKIYKQYQKKRVIEKNLLEDFTEILPKGSRVLDVGCGPGDAAKFLTENKFRVVGIDISKNMLKLARNNAPKAKFYKMSMTKIEFPNNSFDAIMALYSITHVPRKFHERVLKKFHKILKNRGFLFIVMGARDSPDWEGVEKGWFGTKMFWSHFDKTTNLKLVKNSRFKVVKSRIIKPENDTGTFLLIIAQK